MHTHNSKFNAGDCVWIKPLKIEGRVGQVIFIHGCGGTPLYAIRHAEFSRIVETRLFEDELQGLGEYMDERKKSSTGSIDVVGSGRWG